MRFLRVLLLTASLATPAFLPAAALAPFTDFQADATRHHVALVLPNYPKTADEVRTATEAALRHADEALGALAAQPAAKLTFASTFAALDTITGNLSSFAGQIETVAETSPDKVMRDVAREMSVKIQEWAIGLDYREDVYRVLKAFADARPKLDAQEQRLVDFQLRDYRRAGLTLPAEERKAVEQLRKELSGVEQQFAVNINQARSPLDFTAEELAGVPDSLLQSPGVLQPDGRYRVMANITWHAVAIGENARHADTRRRFYLARNTLAQDTNVPVLAKLVALRAEIAHRLGYATWADYRTETRMARTGAAAMKFEEDLVKGLQPKFAAEMTAAQDAHQRGQQ